MKEPNKLMMQLMTQVFKFDCENCHRYWSFEDFKMHKVRGLCKQDPRAKNLTHFLDLDDE